MFAVRPATALICVHIAACGGPPEESESAASTDLTEVYAPGSAPEAIDTGSSSPSPWSGRIDGQAYTLDLRTATGSSPEGFIELVALEFGIQPLFMVSSSSVRTIDLLAAIGDPSTGRQHACVPTDALAGSFTEAPTFTASIAEGHLGMPYVGTDFIRTHDVTLSGTFSETADTVENIAYAARLDMRESGAVWSDLIGIDDPYEMCAILGSFGGHCDACEDGIELCFGVSFEGASATFLDETLVPISEADAGCR